MSEYQYYEFLAIDRPLSEREMGDLRAISSRADITPTRFSNEYSYSSLKADPARLLASYFDVHVYVANWGTHRLVLRLPHEVVSLDEVAPYCGCEAAGAWKEGTHLVVDLRSDTEEFEGWVEGQAWMGSLAGVRAELMRGDRRALYLAWLCGVELGEFDEDDEEPPLPPGLASLSASLRSLVEFLRIDEDLVTAAAEASAPLQAEPTGLATWISELPASEKDALLVRAAQGEHALVAAALMRRFRGASGQLAASDERTRRSVGELLDRASGLREARARELARRKEEARRRHEAAAAAARAKRLDALANAKGEAWADVGRLVVSKKPKAYDQAVRLLVDLRDLAARDGDEPDFAVRLRGLREEHARKSSFIARLNKAGLRR